MLALETGTAVVLQVPKEFGKYRIQKAIGAGATSAVVQAIDVSTGRVYAVKIVSVEDLARRSLLTQFEQEVAILQELSHERIVRVVEVVSDGDLRFVVMENCSGGCLVPPAKDELLRIFVQILEGVRHLHEHGVAHGDIKPENVMLDGDGNVKLIDFGMARRTIIATDREKGGTIMFAAPELLKSGSYHTQKADVWSLGILLFVMATGRFPFAGSERVVVRLIHQGRLAYPADIDQEIAALIRQMTMVNPNRRPTVNELLQKEICARNIRCAKKEQRSCGDDLTQMESEMELSFFK
jgi:serine/threonine protein kinase